MKLIELATLYDADVIAISERIQELSERIATEEDPVEVAQLRRRILELRPLRKQSRELAELTALYYEGGFYRDPKYTL